ncbi:MAG: ABC transporter substrate-binding protein [Pseudomonadota bacterium]
MNANRRTFVQTAMAGALAAVLLLPTHGPAAALSGPESYVQNVANKIVATINSGGSAGAFSGLVTRYADFRTIARFSLGKYRKNLPASRANEYYRLTKSHIARLLQANTKSFRGAKLQIVSSSAKSASNIVVRSKVIYSNGSSIPVNWRVVKRGGGYKIFDVTVKGVSMAITLRTSFTSHIAKNQGKVASLITHLKR